MSSASVSPLPSGDGLTQDWQNEQRPSTTNVTTVISHVSACEPTQMNLSQQFWTCTWPDQLIFKQLWLFIHWQCRWFYSNCVLPPKREIYSPQHVVGLTFLENPHVVNAIVDVCLSHTALSNSLPAAPTDWHWGVQTWRCCQCDHSIQEAPVHTKKHLKKQ